MQATSCLRLRDDPAPSTGEMSMTLLTNDDFAKRELSASELETISAGIVERPRPNPPPGGAGGGCHGPHHPLPPIHFYPLNFHGFK